MQENCLRCKIESAFPIEDVFLTELILLGCDFCKKTQENKEINQYTRLFIEPLLISQRKHDSAFMRMLGSYMLEKTAEAFPSCSDLEKEIKAFFASLANSVQKNVALRQAVKSVSPHVFLKTLARLYFNEQYDTMFHLACCYALENMHMSLGGLRTRIYYQNEIFFDLGVSLDEGMTEHVTLEMMKLLSEKCFEEYKQESKNAQESDTEKIKENLLSEVARLKDPSKYDDSEAYFFEVRFFRKLCESLNIDAKEFTSRALIESATHVLYKYTKNFDPCVFYDLFKTTDEQKWKDAYNILKEMRG